MSDAAFQGFPGIARSTTIPNLFFEAVLPGLTSPAALLAFLWVSRLTQDQTGDARCADADAIWASAAARRSFDQLAGGRPGLEAGLTGAVASGALIALRLRGQSETTVYFVNNPQSRRAIIRARAGQLTIRPGVRDVELEAANPPGIYRLYEEHIGTITPMVAERLVQLADMHPPEWVEDAFREAATRNVRNLRYIERILESWAEEGRANEGAPSDSLADRKRKYLGGKLWSRDGPP